MCKIVILALERCMAGAVTAPADLFTTANHVRSAMRDDAGDANFFTILTASLDGKAVQCGNGQRITPDLAVADIQYADLILVPGLMVNSERELLANLSRLGALSEFLRKMHAQGSVISTGCTGSFMLAEAGLLDGLEATTTWWLTEAFCRRYPDVKMRARQMVVESGTVITAAAGSSYLDISLLLIGKLAGPHIARQCAAYLCIDGPREAQTAYAIPHHRQERDPFIEKADLWIRENLNLTAGIPRLAKHLGVSVRTLVRRFKSATGRPPSDYIQTVRIDHAKFLLENTRSAVSQIAFDVGYRDEDAFRRAFKKTTTITPTAFRKRSSGF